MMTDRSRKAQQYRIELVAAVAALTDLLRKNRRSPKVSKIFELLLAALVRKRVTPSEIRKLMIAIRKEKIPGVSIMAGTDSLAEGFTTAKDFVGEMLNLAQPLEPWREVTIEDLLGEIRN